MRQRLFEPFALACGLNLLVALSALLFMPVSAAALSQSWLKGFSELQGFAMQMVLMLLLGHVLAMSRGVQKPLHWLLNILSRMRHPAMGLVFVSAFLSWLHWGLGLVAGGLLAARLAQQEEPARLRYAAAAYAGFIVWHGGWSGSAPLVVATAGHPWEAVIGVIPVQQTLLSPLNLALLIGVTLSAMICVRFLPNTVPLAAEVPFEEVPHSSAAGWDYTLVLGLVLLSLSTLAFVMGWQGFDLNALIVLLFALALCLHGHYGRFQDAVVSGISATAGIVIQFPLYGAIMAMMRDSGLAVWLAEMLLAWTPPYLFLNGVFWAAGLLNLVVPSGGGQWAVQAPVIVPVAQKLGASLPQTVIAFSWGDAWTNLIQPFWALPLLAMTGVKASQLLPYTALLCAITGLAASAIFLGFSLI